MGKENGDRRDKIIIWESLEAPIFAANQRKEKKKEDLQTLWEKLQSRWEAGFSSNFHLHGPHYTTKNRIYQVDCVINFVLKGIQWRSGCM